MSTSKKNTEKTEFREIIWKSNMEESCFAALLSQLDGVYGFMIVRRIFKPHKIILCIFGQYDGSCDVPYTDLPLSLEKTEQYKNILAFGVLGTLTVQKSK